MEFDDRDWTRREWIKINEIFHVFLVENTVLWAPRTRQKLLPDCDKLPSLTSSGSPEGILLACSGKFYNFILCVSS